jgi:undecaprenyl diphosphate synthase
MDGNRRWASRHFLPKVLGHQAGADNLKKLSADAEKMGVKYLTVYAFSTENWRRDKQEIDGLMNILRRYIRDYINDSEKNNAKINVVGDFSVLADDLVKDIKYLIDYTKNKKGVNTIIALNYGGRDEIVRAAKRIIADLENSKTDFNSLTEESFQKYLDTSPYPDPELIIRTGGEIRTSNFLLWQSAYSEFYFTDKLWPDFSKEDLIAAIEEYNRRTRNYGGGK